MNSSHDRHHYIDPVCRMKVGPNHPVPSYTFGANTYHFCAKACREAFIADPDKFLTDKSAKRKGWWARYLERLNRSTGGKPPCCH